MVSSKAYRHFLALNANTYPYNECMKTRQKFHVRWVLCKMKGRSHAGEVLCMHCSMFAEATHQCLVMTKQVHPVPPDMEEIVACMHHWGRDNDSYWYHHTMDWLHWSLAEGVYFPKNMLARSTIQMKVCRMAVQGLNFEYDTERLLDEWALWFDLQYIDGNTVFFHLAHTSIACAEDRIDDILFESES